MSVHDLVYELRRRPTQSTLFPYTTLFRSEKAREQFAECGPVRLRGRVRIGQGSANLIGGGTFEVSCGALHGSENSVAERHLACPASFVIRGGQVDSFGALAGRPEAMIDLGKVVIFGGKPEDGHSRSAGGVQFLGKAQRR